MSALEEFARQYGYAFLFGGVLLENAGLPVPGETAVLISGFLASPAGGGHFHVLGVILVTFVAAVLGGLPLLLRHLRGQRPEIWQRMFRAQIWVGLVAALLEVVFIALLVWMARPPEEIETDQDVDIQVRHRLRPFLLEMPYANVLVEFGRYAGSLPVAAGVTLLLGLYLRRRGRGWPPLVAMFGALIGSEALGLILHGLLHHRGLHAVEGLPWPDNIVEVAPLRALAVFGMAVYLLGREV